MRVITKPAYDNLQLLHMLATIWISSVKTYNMGLDCENIQYQHAHSYFCLGVHVPPGVSIWGYMFIFEGTHILELFFHSKRIEAIKSDHLDVYNSDIIML